jgi:hypothetical protein
VGIAILLQILNPFSRIPDAALQGGNIAATFKLRSTFPLIKKIAPGDFYDNLGGRQT